MPHKKRDFYGKEITDAIKKACDELAIAQEKLDIEVVETGSTGIFGLIRKKAHIRVSVKVEPEEENTRENGVVDLEPDDRKEVEPAVSDETAIPIDAVNEEHDEAMDDFPEIDDYAPLENGEEHVQLSQEDLGVIKNELGRLLELMGYPSEVLVESDGISVHCVIRGSFEEALTGQDGKTLDSLQYILRKIIARKIPGRLRLSIDIGDFRERRQKELAEKARELAKMVKEDGKTQVLAALNPSERRVVHMALQEDKEIRSRSVGEGLFKKILIYKPGKGRKAVGRKRNSTRGNRPKNGKNENDKS